MQDSNKPVCLLNIGDSSVVRNDLTIQEFLKPYARSFPVTPR